MRSRFEVNTLYLKLKKTCEHQTMQGPDLQ